MSLSLPNELTCGQIFSTRDVMAGSSSITNCRRIIASTKFESIRFDSTASINNGMVSRRPAKPRITTSRASPRIANGCVKRSMISCASATLPDFKIISIAADCSAKSRTYFFASVYVPSDLVTYRESRASRRELPSCDWSFTNASSCSRARPSPNIALRRFSLSCSLGSTKAG